MKRIHGNSVKPPAKYTAAGWVRLRKYWQLPEYKEKSKKMAETRKLVQHYPSVGRIGYAGQQAKQVSALYMLLYGSIEVPVCVIFSHQNMNGTMSLWIVVTL